MKKWLKILLVLIAAAAIGAYWMYNKPFEKMEGMEAQHKITAAALFSEFEQDEARANARYVQPKPAVVEVSGVVSEASKNQDGSWNVLLKTDSDMNFVVCELDTHCKPKRTDFKSGEQVTFKGLCAGLTMDVVLNRCVEIR